MKITCQKLVIGNRELYLGLAIASEIVRYYKIDQYQKGEDGKYKGHQRILSEPRSKKFAQYLENGGIFHQTILVNIRKKSNVEFKNIKDSYGLLNIKSNEGLWVVDGQHRVGGLKKLLEGKPDMSDIKVPILIMVGVPEESEATEFLIVNKTQKGVKASLADALIVNRVSEKDLPLLQFAGIKVAKDELKVLFNVTEKLNKIKESTWKNKISMEGVDPEKSSTINQKSFIDSLKLFRKDAVMEANFDSEQKLTKLLIEYWKGISLLCPKATKTQTCDEYVLMRTAGVFIMHRLLPTVVVKCKGNYSASNIKKILSKIESMKDLDWHNEEEIAKGSGQKWFAYWYDIFKDELK
jgi:DGQHR domain-containing protein